MWKSSGKNVVVAVLFFTASFRQVQATGDYGSGQPYWLDTGAAIDKSPEFFWDAELRELAAPYQPTEKPVWLPAGGAEGYPKDTVPTHADQAAKVDGEDFAEALKKGLVKSADATAAAAKHKAARLAVAAANEASTAELPAEEPSEFADYHKGAFAFHKGEKHYAEARTAWEALLKRPAEERHYRTVPAVFMLGKLAIFAGDREAVKLFQKVRKLAAEGFADSAGLAADSYGWEAKSELDQGHMEKSAKLYLTQLSLGDDTALVSLKAFVPDRGQMMNSTSFDATGHLLPAETELSDTAKNDLATAAAATLAESAKSPVLRSLVTAHVLATETVISDQPGSERGAAWLETLEQAKIKKVDDADRLGWVAYAAGKYDVAKRWLKLQPKETGTSLWLQSKLARRAGKTAEAVKFMTGSLHAFGPVPDGDENEKRFQIASHGDMAVLHLSQSDYVQALDEFLGSDLQGEASYLLEQVLTADEAIAYVDKHFPAAAPAPAPATSTGEAEISPGEWVRNCLARRLVREDRYKEARTYLQAKDQKELDEYVALLDKAANAKLPKMARARAWFDAASMVSDELMGYRSSPVENYRDRTPIPGASMKGKLSERDAQDFPPETKPDPTIVPPTVTADEKKRIAKYREPVFKGGFIRHVTSVLMWKSAELLPDQSDELADVLNTGGNWIKGDYRGDDAMADKFFQAIERRASKTAVGREASKKHWLVDHWGPWSIQPKDGN